jgi:hypothetical protein
MWPSLNTNLIYPQQQTSVGEKIENTWTCNTVDPQIPTTMKQSRTWEEDIQSITREILRFL